MRILCLNGNTTKSITSKVGNEMRRTLGQSATVIDATPAFGPAIINTRVDVAVASHAIVETAINHETVDAIMLAVSFDTSRDALREALAIPVIGMTEASIALARMQGRRIGYVSLGKNITPIYHETLTHCHIQADIAAWRTIEAPTAYQAGDTSEADARVLKACLELMNEGADVVVLLGAVLAGAARRVQPKCDIPLIDGGAAGALMARTMVELTAYSIDA